MSFGVGLPCRLGPVPSLSLYPQLYANLVFLDYTEGAELVESVLDVVRKEAEGTDCFQGELRRPITLFGSWFTSTQVSKSPTPSVEAQVPGWVLF